MVLGFYTRATEEKAKSIAVDLNQTFLEVRKMRFQFTKKKFNSLLEASPLTLFEG